MRYLLLLTIIMFANSFRNQYKFNTHQINAIRSLVHFSPRHRPSSLHYRNGGGGENGGGSSSSSSSGRNSPLFGKKSDTFRARDDYCPKSHNQQKYVDALHNSKNDIVVCYGPAGTGKTMFACNAAVNELEKGNVKKIILTRPVVSVDEELGYLPGNIVSKMDPWTRPIMDIFMEFYSKHEVETMIQEGVIEISPLAFMRGRTFKKAFIIADEMQNSSPNQMLMLITRIGSHSKMVITGDLRQSDRCSNNGLLDLVKRLRWCMPHGIDCIELNGEDVFRSSVVSRIIKLYEMTPEGSACSPQTREKIHTQSQNATDINEYNDDVGDETDECGGGDNYDYENVVEMEIEIEELEKNSELEVAAGMDEESRFTDNYLHSPSNSSSASFGVEINKVEHSERERERERDKIEDIVIVYKEGHNDSALIPKSHITRNIIRFFNSSNTHDKH